MRGDMSHLRIRLSIACLCATAILGSQVDAASSIGFVADVRGFWTISGNKSVSKGMAVAPGAVIELDRRGARQAETASIEIVLLNGQHIPVTCRISDSACDKIFIPTSLVPESSFTKRLIAAVTHLFFREPARYVSALTRGGGYQQTVLRLDGGRLTLNPVLRNMPAGKYAIPFTRASARTGELVPRSTTVLHVGWDGKAATAIAPRSFTSGLYGAGDTTGGDTVLILVASGRDYARVSESFAQAVQFAARWPDSATNAARRGFERAALLALASGLSQHR